MNTQCYRGVCILLPILLVPLVIGAAVLEDGTRPPFVRSRYSRRWQRTTVMPIASASTAENSANVATSTSAPTNELNVSNLNNTEVVPSETEKDPKLVIQSDGVDVMPANNVVMTTQHTHQVPPVVGPLMSVSFYGGRWLTTTEHSKLRSSTHSTDYDYYSENEIDGAK